MVRLVVDRSRPVNAHLLSDSLNSFTMGPREDCGRLLSRIWVSIIIAKTRAVRHSPQSKVRGGHPTSATHSQREHKHGEMATKLAHERHTLATRAYKRRGGHPTST